MNKGLGVRGFHPSNTLHSTHFTALFFSLPTLRFYGLVTVHHRCAALGKNSLFPSQKKKTKP